MTTATQEARRSIELSEEQKEVIMHQSGPLLVLAGPGSGKSTLLIERMKHLLQEGVPPKRMMALTFTKKAALELKERLKRHSCLTPGQLKAMTVGTFHSVCYAILRSAGMKQKILASETIKEHIIQRALKELGLEDSYYAEDILRELSFLKNQGIDIGQLQANSQIEKDYLAAWKEYEAVKQAQKEIDFDDILLLTLQLLETDPHLLSALQRQFEHLLIDEYQDTNYVQARIVELLAAPQNNILAVGDDKQAIYGFRGASTRYILGFQEQFQGATVMTLGKNYRSTKQILNLASHVISYNKQQYSMELEATRPGGTNPVIITPADEVDEAKAVTELIKQLHESGRAYSDIAVLYRTADISRPLFEQLTMEEIPFFCYNNRPILYELECVRPIISYLQLSLDPGHAEALKDVLPSMYLSPKKAWEQIKKVGQPEIEHLLQLPGLKDFQQEHIAKIIKVTRSLSEQRPDEAIQNIRSQFYDRFLAKSYKYPLDADKDMLQEKLDELEKSASRFDSVPHFLSFVQQVVAKNEEMRGQNGAPDKLSLKSIHVAKGAEHPVTVILSSADGVIPHNKAIQAKENGTSRLFQAHIHEDDPLEEEARILFVAITRAKDAVYISCPGSYKNKTTECSRFLRGNDIV